MNQVPIFHDVMSCSLTTPIYNVSDLPVKHEEIDAVLQPQEVFIHRPKNVPEELKMFLMTHSDQWYTNESVMFVFF